MKVINPTPIVDGVLQSSSLAEDPAPAWASGTTYAAGAVVSSGVSHRVYQSAVGGNLGNNPTTSPAVWTDIGPTNRWAMFDQAVGTTSDGTGSITINMTPGAIRALAILDTNASEVHVVMSVSGSTVYDETKSTNAGGSMIVDWYEYFFADVGTLSTLTFLDLPSYSNCAMTVTITGPDPGGLIRVGTLLVGTIIEMGLTETGPSIGISDFSRKVTDDFGATNIVERAWAKRMTIRSMIQTAQADNIQRRLAALRAKPALYLGEEGFDSLAVYGFYKDFSIDLALENLSYCSLTIEGLI